MLSGSAAMEAPSRLLAENDSKAVASRTRAGRVKGLRLKSMPSGGFSARCRAGRGQSRRLCQPDFGVRIEMWNQTATIRPSRQAARILLIRIAPWRICGGAPFRRFRPCLGRLPIYRGYGMPTRGVTSTLGWRSAIPRRKRIGFCAKVTNAFSANG